MNITVKEASCVVRDSIPVPDETFATDFYMDEFPIHMVKSLSIYLRDAFDCPFGRSNWLCDVNFKDGGLYCVKLPANMREEDVMRYFKPLIDAVENCTNE